MESLRCKDHRYLYGTCHVQSDFRSTPTDLSPLATTTMASQQLWQQRQTTHAAQVRPHMCAVSYGNAVPGSYAILSTGMADGFCLRGASPVVKLQSFLTRGTLGTRLRHATPSIHAPSSCDGIFAVFMSHPAKSRYANSSEVFRDIVCLWICYVQCFTWRMFNSILEPTTSSRLRATLSVVFGRLVLYVHPTRICK